MKAGVQLGLLCLSLLIWSLDGGKIDPESSREIPVNFDAEDYSQFQVAENERERNVMSHESDISPVFFRMRRQDKGKRPRPRRPPPGKHSLLASASSVKIVTV